MGAEVARRLLVIGEDRAHWETIRIWSLTYAMEKVAWIKDGGYDRVAAQAFLGEWRPADRWLPFRDVRRYAWGQGPRRLGDFRGAEKGGPGFKSFVDALVAAQKQDPQPEVVLVGRDTDNGLDRNGAVQARSGLPWPFKIVFAIAAPEVEAWHIAVWQPADEAAKARHADLTATLGFDPVRRPERLSSSPASRAECKSTARSLQTHPSWQGAGSGQLEQVTSPIGLAEFLADLREQFFPLVGRVTE